MKHMDMEKEVFGKEPMGFVPEEEEGEAFTPKLHPRIIESGKEEAKAGEGILADMKPRWLACVLATMCAIEEHGKSNDQRDDIRTV